MCGCCPIVCQHSWNPLSTLLKSISAFIPRRCRRWLVEPCATSAIEFPVDSESTLCSQQKRQKRPHSIRSQQMDWAHSKRWRRKIDSSHSNRWLPTIFAINRLVQKSFRNQRSPIHISKVIISLRSARTQTFVSCQKAAGGQRNSGRKNTHKSLVKFHSCC